MCTIKPAEVVPLHNFRFDVQIHNKDGSKFLKREGTQGIHSVEMPSISCENKIIGFIKITRMWDRTGKYGEFEEWFKNNKKKTVKISILNESGKESVTYTFNDCVIENYKPITNLDASDYEVLSESILINPLGTMKVTRHEKVD